MMAPDAHRQRRIHSVALELLPVTLGVVSQGHDFARMSDDQRLVAAKTIGALAAEIARAAAEKIAGLELAADIRDARSAEGSRCPEGS